MGGSITGYDNANNSGVVNFHSGNQATKFLPLQESITNKNQAAAVL